MPEEHLKLASGDFSDTVDLLNQLLQESVDIPLVERCFVGTDRGENLGVSLAFSDNGLYERRERDHGFFTDPATDITSSIELIVVESLEHSIEGQLEKLSWDPLNAECHDHVDEGLDSLFTCLGIVRLFALSDAVSGEGSDKLVAHLLEQAP